MDRTPPSTPASRNWPLISGVSALVLALLLGVLIAARAGNLPLSFDERWMNEILAERSVWLEVPARFMDWLGGGLVGVLIIPVGIVVALCVARRWWGALFYALAALVSVGVVQGLKALFSRPRPDDILVVADVGSFPSGHVANAATMAVVLAIIIAHRWVWVAGAAYVVLMALSRTYLGAHWVSDTVGGALIGVGVAVIAWAPLAARLRAEQQKWWARGLPASKAGQSRTNPSSPESDAAR